MQIVQASSAMSMGALRAPPLSLVPARPLEAIPRIQTHAAAPTSAFPAPSCYVCASRQRRATPFMFANETIGDEVGPRVDAARDDSAAGTWQALLALNAAALIWGSQHAVIKSLVESIGSPAVLNAARFSIAAAAALPWWPGAPWRSSDETSAVDAEARAQSVSTTWAAGAELGVWTFLGFGLQAISLQYTTATRSAFLLYLNVKLVPILALLLYGRQSPLQTWISALIAFSGTGKSRKSPLPFSPICHRPPPPPHLSPANHRHLLFAALLSFDGSPPNIGDAWSLAAAVASACFILRLEEAAGKTQPAELNAAAIASAALLSVILASFELALSEAPAELIAHFGDALSAHWGELLYLALFTTAVAQWLQALGQSRISAQQSAIIFSLDPVYGAGFSWLLLGETFGLQGWAGGALIVAAVVLSQSSASGISETQNRSKSKQ